MTNQVRVRFAPSPTGYLHVGGARTALFNWLFARHHDGKFILRIEDTDVARSSAEMVEGILRGMRWLGLNWDEGPFFQSERIERYRAFAGELLSSNCAYRCFCSPEDLVARREAQKASARNWHYDRRCAGIPAEESASRAQTGAPFAVRFLVPEGKTSFRDGVFGEIEVENKTLEDFVLLRSDGMPTYHLSVVVDDLDMNITHVVRGADHISNTPKQILLYQATKHALPEFAHLPLIMGPDKQRLSKRHGATSVMAYAEMGYLPDAFFNFLTLLGWSPGNDCEILSRQELVELFSLDGVGKANAVFGLEKLDWFNSQYINRATPRELRDLAVQELRAQNIWRSDEAEVSQVFLDRSLELLKSRIRRPSDLSTVFRAFFTEDFDYDQDAAAKFLRDSRLKDLVQSLCLIYQDDHEFTLESTEKKLRSLSESLGVKAGLLINALRVGLTGQGVAPGLFEIMQALGRERTLKRVKRLAEYLSQ
jgi:glutamyl-tRNA synthetase